MLLLKLKGMPNLSAIKVEGYKMNAAQSAGI